MLMIVTLEAWHRRPWRRFGHIMHVAWVVVVVGGKLRRLSDDSAAGSEQRRVCFVWQIVSVLAGGVWAGLPRVFKRAPDQPAAAVYQYLQGGAPHPWQVSCSTEPKFGIHLHLVPSCNGYSQKVFLGCNDRHLACL